MSQYRFFFITEKCYDSYEILGNFIFFTIKKSNTMQKYATGPKLGVSFYDTRNHIGLTDEIKLLK